MRLDNSRESRNVEDRRGRRMHLGGRGKIGIGTIVLALVAIYFGVDPSVVLQNVGEPTSGSASYDTSAGEAGQTPELRFVSRVLGDTEETWHALFSRHQLGSYHEPKLILYTGATSSACGMGQAAVGPFYCPGDASIYLDLSFFRQLERDLGSPGDFAQAYVLAHEVAHHVQNQLGIMDEVSRARSRMNAAQANALSVRVELQADCFSGVWAHHSDAQRATLEPGDIEEGLNAAAAIGDDRLQKRTQGHVVPDSFTHGSSAQRVRWFTRGYESGDPARCDTFSAAQL